MNDIKLFKELPVIYEKKMDCSGCSACFSICPVNAIQMISDNEGFEYPVVSEELCIRCYRCMKVCPTNSYK